MSKFNELLNNYKLTSVNGKSGRVFEIAENYIIFKSYVGRNVEGKYYPYYFKVLKKRLFINRFGNLSISGGKIKALPIV